MPMGLIGTGLNARHLMEVFNLQIDIAIELLIYGWLSFVILMFHYLWNLSKRQQRGALIDEWYDPFRRSFLPAISLTTILFIVSIAQVFEFNHYPNQYWLLLPLLFVASLHFLLNIFLINGWLFDEKLTLNQHKPTWYILLSGNFIIVIALNTEFIVMQASLLYEISMFFYSISLFLWIVFSTSLFYRLIFNTHLQISLRPSLFIFLAPSSLACLASLLLSEDFLTEGVVTQSSVGIITWISFSFATMMLMAWLISYRFFMSSGLSMAGWSFVYPLAAYGLALQYLAQALHSSILMAISVMVFLAIILLILLLTFWLIKLSLYSVAPKVQRAE